MKSSRARALVALGGLLWMACSSSEGPLASAPPGALPGSGAVAPSTPSEPDPAPSAPVPAVNAPSAEELDEGLPIASDPNGSAASGSGAAAGAGETSGEGAAADAGATGDGETPAPPGDDVEPSSIT